MSAFTDAELAYLDEGPGLARVATVGPDGMPHVVPSGWSFDPETDTMVLGGMNLERTKKFRDAAATGRIVLVIDDVPPPWKPRGIEVRGRAEAIRGPDAQIRVHPERIVSWGLESDRIGARHGRDVGSAG
jgi:pyridoxamine 5'-phosphate oxidase family protein